MIVLGIESSCDESAVALYDTERGLLGHRLYSQIDLHVDYGGVVPELASRDHVRKIVPLIRELVADSDMELSDVEGIAYTAGPGLVGALLVGASAARALAFSLGVPTLAVNHLEGHLLAPLLETRQPEFPFLCLLVSGGHTQIIDVAGIGDYRLLGESIDDAAGEAFDKTAKMMGLPYPGGPVLSKLAERGDEKAFKFKRPMVDRPGIDMSFSGLKTAAITAYRQAGEGCEADIAASFQATVVDTLFIKCQRALKQSGRKRLIVAGGVGANRRLRETFQREFSAQGIEVFYPSLAFCTDNGAMIALAGGLRMAAGQRDTEDDVSVRPRWPLEEVTAL